MFLKARPTKPALLQAQKKLPHVTVGIPTVPSPPGQGEMIEAPDKQVEETKMTRDT